MSRLPRVVLTCPAPARAGSETAREARVLAMTRNRKLLPIIITLSFIVLLAVFFSALLSIFTTFGEKARILGHAPAWLQRIYIDCSLSGGIVVPGTGLADTVVVLDHADRLGIALDYDRKLLIPFLDDAQLATKYNHQPSEVPVRQIATSSIMGARDKGLIDSVMEAYKSNPAVAARFCNAPGGDFKDAPDYEAYLEARCRPFLSQPFDER
jgi:hypothetical protein